MIHWLDPNKLGRCLKQNGIECDNLLIRFEINSNKNSTNTTYLMPDFINLIDFCKWILMMKWITAVVTAPAVGY